MQCYLRQRWYDNRLRFNLENITEVTLSNSFLKYIWKPNTYFINGRRSQQPNITVPNVFVRIRQDGRIYMSRRLTIHAVCPMKMMEYPMDRPVCPLIISSYGYTVNDILYIWKNGQDKSVEMYEGVTMSQFNIRGIQTKNLTKIDHNGEHSVLEVYFHLKRHVGFFVLQTYLPCTLIVCLSWVSFWINRDAAPARVLLVTTILSTASTGMMVRDGLPRVPYATALDVYLNVCIVYNLAAMIEYAAVNYFTKIIPKEGSTSDSEEEQKEIKSLEDQSISPLRYIDIMKSFHQNIVFRNNRQQKCIPVTDPKSNGIIPTESNVRHYSCYNLFLRCLVGNYQFRNQNVARADLENGNSVSKIDMTSRYFFPASFIFFHAFYWSWYWDSGNFQTS
ncbi:gamma-aminobutyric acid receptor subunit alpha [Mytilus galloprovincialis]|uniref:Gamma-aminobutyric acid receptor subunit alpha n=1 Tax=Mytilus galloprovincialis TaxID=29158 RepID=A0A8B6GJE6_MYTGA|nr:gamma-aminobutyric acid receptor subunit alpha [Mytilus galloprovincialis]